MRRRARLAPVIPKKRAPIDPIVGEFATVLLLAAVPAVGNFSGGLLAELMESLRSA